MPLQVNKTENQANKSNNPTSSFFGKGAFFQPKLKTNEPAKEQDTEANRREDKQELVPNATEAPKQQTNPIDPTENLGNAAQNSGTPESIKDDFLKIDGESPEVVAAFKEVNKGLKADKLKEWIRISIERGWHPGATVPDYKEPSITFNEKGEPIIEAVGFRGERGAFNTASKILPKDVGAKFWWKKRFGTSLGQYILGYSSNTAAMNLNAHEKKKDVDFEALKTISGDIENYNQVIKIKAYSDKLLSEALVRLIANTQAVLYPNDLKKQTGFLDEQTNKDVAAKIASDILAAQQKKENSNADATQQGSNLVEVEPGPIHEMLDQKIATLEKETKEPVPTAIVVLDKVDSLPFSPLPDLPAEFIYRIGQHGMLGFFRHLKTIPEAEIKRRFYNILLAPLSWQYMWGQIKGVPQGIWDWIVDLFSAIWELIKSPYTINKFFIEKLMDLPSGIKASQDAALKAQEWFVQNKAKVFQFIKDLITKPGETIQELSNAMKTKAYEMAENMGGGLASKIAEFAGKTKEAIGESIGKLQGYLLPDILLLVFSGSIGNIIKGALQSFKAFATAVKGSMVVTKIMEVGKAVWRGLGEFIEGAKLLAREVYTEIKAMLKQVWEFLGKVFGVGEKGSETGKIVAQIENKISDLKGAKGLIGQAYEEFLHKNLSNATGSFTKMGREFDGTYNGGNIWFEAKSGNYWRDVVKDVKGLEKFKSDMGSRLSIAKANGKEYELFSNTPIPENVKKFLDKKLIKWHETLN